MSKRTYEVVIVGGGHMGLILGSMLARQKIDVALVEKRDLSAYRPSRDPSRLLSIAHGSVEVLRKNGISIDFPAIGQEIKTISVLENGLSEGYLEFRPHDIGVKSFGFMVEEQELTHVLLKNSKRFVGFKPFYNLSVTGLSQDGGHVTLTLSNGASIHSRLVIAADGRHSTMRKMLGIETYEHDYHQYALVCDIKHELNHQGVAIEKFLPSGPFASLPKKGGFISSIVWTVEEDTVNTLKVLDQDSLIPLLEARFGGCFGRIEIASVFKIFKLERVLAKKYFEGRVALLGDALHSIHPLAGQGLNLSIRDADYLCDAIVRQRSLGLDIGNELLLEDYQKYRHVDNIIMSEATHSLNFLFSNNIGLISAARKLGLNLIDSTGFLKKTFMKYAAKGLN